MGAICGYVGDAPRGILARALELLAHRGGSGQGVLERPGLGIGELGARAGVASSADGTVACVMDGRLLNRRELRAALHGEGSVAPLASDAEIVAEAYRAYGTRAFERLDGPFALAVVDDRSLILVRDPLGEKPVYYAPGVAGSWLFASEIKAFLAHPAFTPKPDPSALLRLLVFSFIPGRETAFSGVCELEPGTLVSVPLRGGEPSSRRYWDLVESVASRSEPELVEELGVALRAAVERRLPEPGVPLGAFLSGGVDSSAVVALLAELGRPPICYSASFGYGQPNELIYATLVTAHCELEHRVIDVVPEDFIHVLPRILWCLDDPLCDCITVPNYVLAQTASREVPVVFNGEGGDPLFGGPKNKFMILGEWYSFFGGYERTKAYLASYHKFYDYLSEACSDEFLHAAGGIAALEHHVDGFLDNPSIESFLNRLMHVNIRLKGGQNILVKVDKMLAPNGVEACSPLFDKELAELSFAMPPSLKRKGDVEKYVFKKAVEDLLPHPVVYRKKAGMGVPLNHWFRKTALRSYTRDLLGGARARQRGYFRPEFVERLLAHEAPEGHLGRDRGGELLWMLLALEIWHRVYVDGDLRP